MDDTRYVKRPRDFVERFWSYVAVTSECWYWTASLNGNGYGQYNDYRGRHTTLRAHRFAYELTVGPIPDGLEIDHLCRNRACVNPDHLEVVTRQVNIARSVPATGERNGNGRKTHCPQGHPYAGSNLRATAGRRYCRTCQAAALVRFHSKNAA